MSAIVRPFALAVIGVALCAPAITSYAADLEVTCTGLGYGQRRVLEHSFQGVDALRRYVLITRPVYQIGMVEAMESLDDWRANAKCTTRTTADASRGAAAPVAPAAAGAH